MRPRAQPWLLTKTVRGSPWLTSRRAPKPPPTPHHPAPMRSFPPKMASSRAARSSSCDATRRERDPPTPRKIRWGNGSRLGWGRVGLRITHLGMTGTEGDDRRKKMLCASTVRSLSRALLSRAHSCRPLLRWVLGCEALVVHACVLIALNGSKALLALHLYRAMRA